MSYPKGSEWRKWDLHVHTPFSMVQHYEGANEEERWENFISDLESLPSEFKVIGINDYLFIDGYERVLEYKKAGRLKNIETFLPVVEFRIKKFGGHKAFKRINFHIIFSDKLAPAIIKQQFLNQLYGQYKLAPEIDGLHWGGYITKESLADLGKAIKDTVPTENLSSYGSDISEGFNNLNFDEVEVVKILKSSTSYLKDNFLTAIGKTEWDEFSWNDNSIADKKTVINNVDFVFTSSETINAYNKAKRKLTEQKVNDLLLDCSDAHRSSNSENKDRVGKCFTWIKADPTFEGLKQIIHEPDRLFVGGLPELLQRKKANPNKFIQTVSIKRVSSSSMPEVWYREFNIDLNPSLVAVIGNKGNGKSALTDIIGLIGNSYNDNYSFLTRAKFRNPRPYNRAANTEAQIVWSDKSRDGYLRLDTAVDLNKPEKVKYIPQNFLESLCVNEDEHDFEKEIKKIIFTHTDPSERLGFSNLDELITYKSEVINKELGSIKGEVEDINLKVINLERKSLGSFRQSLTETLQNKEEELKNHESLKPEEKQAPSNNTELEARNKDIHTEIENVKKAIAEKEERLKYLNESKSRLLQDLNELDKVRQSFKNLKETLDQSVVKYKAALEQFDLNLDNVLKYEVNLAPIINLSTEKNNLLNAINHELVGKGEENKGLEEVIAELYSTLTSLEEKLDEPYRLYQKYLTDLEEWSNRRKAIIGSVGSYGTIEHTKSELKYLDEMLPNELNIALEERNQLVRKLFNKKSEIIELYKKSYKPITDFIDKYAHLMKDYQVNISVEFTLDGFVNKFFDHISQGARGTYIGLEEGHKFLNDLIPQFDINDSDGLINFLNAIRESLQFDKRPDQNNIKRELEQQLKKSYTVDDFYRFLFGIDFLKPTFKLNLGDKSLSELSPGERGALLLIFYLFLDKDDKPLLIDQPEENLDNQSVYNYLVHFIKEAKKRRQIIIVTHNPNLAVVCDAEQVIHMEIDKTRNNTVSYKSGAIENPKINTTIVDILEGTKPAFNNRTNKYSLARVL